MHARRHFRQENAPICNFALQVSVFRRIDDIDPAGDDRGRAAVECRRVGGGIDSAGEARDHNAPAAGQIARERPGEPKSCGRRIPRTDDGNARAVGKSGVAGDGKDRGARIDMAEQRRIIRFTQGNVPRAKLRYPVDLAFGGVSRVHPDPSGDAAFAGEIGQSLQRTGRRFECTDKIIEGPRSHIGAPCKPQPVDLFAFAERSDLHGLVQDLPRIFDSSPRNSLPILARWARMMTAVMATKSSATCRCPNQARTPGVAADAIRAEREE